MVRTQAVFALIIGLVVVSFHDATAKDNISIASKAAVSTNIMLAPLADNFLYTLFACKNKQNGLRLPIAGSCVDFFECFEGKTVRKTCPEGTQFSNHGLACLDARLSKCRPEQEEIACKGPCCSREDGLYPAEDGCSNFFICISGHSYHRTCGNVLQFDAVNLICDIPERARCGTEMEKEVEEVETVDVVKGEEATAISRPPMYRISHRVCKAKTDGYSVPIPGSCNKFYICIGGLGYLKSCGKMQFNPSKHFCDLKSRMYCPEIDEDEVILNDDEDLEEIEAKPLPWEAEEDSDDENKKDIEKVESSDEKLTEEEEEELKEEEQVTALENAEDEEEKLLEVRPGARPSYSKPSEKEELPSNDKPSSPAKVNVCADQPVGALLPMSGECAKYIRCRWDWFERRTAEVLTCPDDMHFNPKTKYCDWAKNVKCIGNSSKSSGAAKKLTKPKYAF